MQDFDMHGTVTRPINVLIVEDDEAARKMLSDYLTERDLRVRVAPGREALDAEFARHKPDIVLLDLQLGQDDGLDILREIRTRTNVPVIIASGSRFREIDRVVGLELGADDYITKPFGLRELLARIHAVLRRRRNGGDLTQRATGCAVYRFCGWELDQKARRVVGPKGAPVTLTRSEYALLVAFLEAPGRPLSREVLLQATRTHEDIFDRSIDVQVLRLRRKLETDPTTPRIIRTERGVGYIFAATVELQN
jgi:two-component system, OmpR family, response regulator